MLTAEKIQKLITLSPAGLSKALQRSGYSGCAFETSKFLGITNGGQFCYSATFFDESGTGEIESTKVFISYDHGTEAVVADF